MDRFKSFEVAIPGELSPKEARETVRALRHALRQAMGRAAEAILGPEYERVRNRQVKPWASFVEMGVRPRGGEVVVRVWCVTANRAQPRDIEWETPLRAILERVEAEGWDCLRG